MLRSIVIGSCLIASLAACVTDNGQSTRAEAQRSSCPTDTGTRVPPSQDRCTAYGRSYSGKDLQQTGEVNVGEALQKLDPSVSVHH